MGWELWVRGIAPVHCKGACGSVAGDGVGHELQSWGRMGVGCGLRGSQQVPEAQWGQKLQD